MASTSLHLTSQCDREAPTLAPASRRKLSVQTLHIPPLSRPVLPGHFETVRVRPRYLRGDSNDTQE
jgi:hypothetical protein